ncbi:MAG: 4-hydroxy-3-methylbut-2-enyl diphosphate reductase [Alphaproteobacteria bacterium]|nr:4-hydroxy-3-methylbut-2-enyl diphosphate reductase [Alphaproteobacteria bacterium]
MSDLDAPAKSALSILLASPRGFCAGVERAILIVEQALERYGPPVYVRHEIVHNRAVVAALEAKGAVFVDELWQIPNSPATRPTGRPTGHPTGHHVIFSAHGVPKSVPRDAMHRGLDFIDATCPLVSKVHREAERRHAQGCQVILIGHAGHPEVDGIIGQLPAGAICLVETVDDAEKVEISDPARVAFVTQTTLAIDQTVEIIATLERRFPMIRTPAHEDICYATTNRQDGVCAIAPYCDLVVVIGSPNSSNSSRLVEVAKRSGARVALLVDRVGEFDWRRLDGVSRLGLTAGASAPEILVEDFIAACRQRYRVTVENVAVTAEDIHFKLPRPLVA